MRVGVMMVCCLMASGLRLVLGVYLLAKLTDRVFDRKILGLSLAGSCLVAGLNMAGVQGICVSAVEIIIIIALTRSFSRQRLRLSLFLAFFYEMGVSLWDFLISAVISLVSGSLLFMGVRTIEHVLSLLFVRFLMILITVLFLRPDRHGESRIVCMASVIALLGLFGVIGLSQQSLVDVSNEKLITWMIFSILLMFAVLLYRGKRQQEMEAEIAELKQMQGEILAREYRALSRTYEDHAKLFHDLHNHVEVIYQCLRQKDIDTAMKYCEELYSLARDISRGNWTGDKAVDYLIGSKIALARDIRIKSIVNIEFPWNTNIRSTDLTTILGNLLDNALEAARTAPEDLRFLNLTIRRINEMLMIKVENGCGESSDFHQEEEGKKREDRSIHGWGMKSVMTAAGHYDGIVDTVRKNDVFQAVVMLSFRPVRRE